LTPSPFYDSQPVELKSFVPETGPEAAPHTRPEPAPAKAVEGDTPRDAVAESKPARSVPSEAGVTFADLALEPALLAALAAEGYETPTPIQARCIPPALDGKDLLGCAQTGTGKTAAFALPVIHRLMTSTKRPLRTPNSPKRKGNRHTPARTPRALVLSPTRELADQIAESFATYGSGAGLRGTVIYGGVSQFRQVKSLQRGVDILVATPGRLLDLMDQGHVDLSSIEIFVLDEADRMLDMGFINPIRKIAEAFPAKPQTMLFSATMPGPIARLADTLLANPVKVEVTPVASAAPLIDQSLYLVDGAHKHALLTHLLEDAGVERAVVFTRTKHGAEKLAKALGKAGIRAESIHGNKNQNQRTRALDAFRSGRSRVLVATDVAARGLDVDGISHVFNFNLPNEPEAYVHRIGRTGRAGATGKAIAFCARDERGFLHAIERLTKNTLDTTPLPGHLGLPEEPPLLRRAPRVGDANREQGGNVPARKGRAKNRGRAGRPAGQGGEASRTGGGAGARKKRPHRGKAKSRQG
jgi:ATP-dependent RNA helicase RhlE